MNESSCSKAGESWRGQTMKELRIQDLASVYGAMSPSSDIQ